MTRGGIPGISYAGRQQLQYLQERYPKSRFLLACKSCYCLKPPVIVEIGTALECPWCFGRNNTILLFETKQTENNEHVEYVLIRERKSTDQFANSQCKDNLGLRWKSCFNGDECTFAHSEIELEMWRLKSRFFIEWKHVNAFFNPNQSKKHNTLKGVFHCFVCCKNLISGKEFSSHCDSSSHRRLIDSHADGVKWKYRPLPEDGSGNFTLCESIESGRQCRRYKTCHHAHSEEELEEWKKRLDLQQEKIEIAKESGLISFSDRILQEYQQSSSSAEILQRSLPGVTILLNHKKKQTILFETKKFTWKLKMNCADPKMKLNHAAFLPSVSESSFSICRLRGGQRSEAKSHLDFTVALNEDYLHNLHDGEVVYEVSLKAETYGIHRGSLVFEFRHSPRPVLLVEFVVNVVGSQEDIIERPEHKELETISWERDRRIIRWKDETSTEFGEVLKELLNKYKQPDAALDYLDEKSSSDLFPISLLAKNYVKDMHNFLYKEELARTKKLAGPRPSLIAMSENYFSAKKGICFNTPGELFAVFEAPIPLNRDTDEGFLILESCSQVLVGLKDFPTFPAYEVMIEEKFVDHLILRFSKDCVQAWNLKTGMVVAVEIQFQLYRETFCRCHCALDQLEQRKLLPLVCPNSGQSNQVFYNNHSDVDGSGLDLDQKMVLAFITSPSSFQQGSILPLFLAQGSFGTGKTYTISKCIMHLLNSDPEAKLLICTHSNSAADRYIHTTFQNADEWRDKVVRIVYHGRNPATLSSLVKGYCLWREDGRGFRYPTSQDVAKHKVFITTFETSLALGVQGTGLMGAFTHIFLDEAAQAMEAETIIPLTLADSMKTKIVVAGDHKQIAQKIYSKERFNDSAYTLLARIFNLYVYDQQTFQNNFIVLRNNYRCVEPILKLIESLFYANDLLVPCSYQQPLPGLKPIQFHHVEGQCIQDPFTSDYFNEAEAFQIAKIVKDLLDSYPMQLGQKDIVVVSSYTHQVRVMRSCLRTHRLGSVLVDRVRNIQGLEYKVVILSCVHKRKDKSDRDGENFGLLSDANLLNTAFTRSMLAVIAVGHATTLWSLGKCNIMWHKYLKACEDQGSLFPASMRVQAIRAEADSLSRLNPEAHGFVPSNPRPPGFAPATRPNQAEVNNQLPASNEDELPSPHPSDDEESDSEALPLKDEILNQIIQRDTGSNVEQIRVKVDRRGREFVETTDDRSDETKNNMHCDFSLPQLKELLRSKPDEYKRCILDITSWNSANAVVLDSNSEMRNILIKTKRALGRSFDKDEVVVHIASENGGATQDNDKPEVYGRVIGVLQRYNDLSVKKFVCVPDPVSPTLVVPVDRKVTKFILLGLTKEMKESGTQIPICQLKGNDVKRIRTVDYDKHSISPYRSHFVVRYVKWLPNFHYPFGYVSEEIEPKNIEKYFSVVHDVPEVGHKPSVEKKAKELSKAKLRPGHRQDLTKLFVFTIDPPGSKDLDDALSLQTCDTHKKCYKIGIHIADVASVLPEGSAVDNEAKKRATTFYSGVRSSNSPRKIAPMLPSSLSTDKCSLLPDSRSRPAISIFIHSSHLPDILSPPNGNAASNLPEPVLTTIRSRRQLTYKDAEDNLRRARESGHENVSTATESNLPDQLQIIWKAMLELRWRRLDGSSFTARPEFNELKRFFDETTAHMLIEEAMITYNACISRFLDANACNFVMRTQDAPAPDEAKEWGMDFSSFIVKSINLQSSLSRVCSLDEARHILNQPRDQSPLPIIPIVWEQINLAIQRNDLESALVLFCSDAIQPAVLPGFSGFLGIQKRAKLLTNVDVRKVFVSSDVTHFSLRLPVYSHCSSPIRRYTDIMAQRMVLLKCQQRQASQSNSNVITLEHVGESGDPANLQTLSKKIEKRMEDAKKYEKQTQNVSFARNLSQEQCYEEATVVEENERGVLLHLLSLKDLPLTSRRLKFRELNLLKQEGTTITWRIRFFDVKAEGESTQGISHKALVSTVVSTRKWIELLRYIRTYFGSRSDDRDAMKSKFQSVLNTRCEFGGCGRQRGDDPCDNDVCRKSKCKDVLGFPSKLGINHYRKITMSLSLGMPLCVQLYCGVEKGISIPLLQLLSVAQDLDICLAHIRSPIEIFAADVTPKRGDKFRDVTEYIDHWLPLYRMEAIYTAIKDGDNTITLKNVAVNFRIKGGKHCGEFSLESTFAAKRLITISTNDFLCIRIKNLSVRHFHGTEEETSLSETNLAPDSYFTWVGHAVVTSSSDEGKDDKCEFKLCTPQVAGPEYSHMITNGKRLATVEVLKLGISDRCITDALQNADNENLPNDEEVFSLCIDKGLPSYPNQNLVEERSNEISVGEEVVPGMKYQLNEGQIQQIKLALGRNVSMIQGPPGTGKSFVGAHLAYYFQQLNMKKTGKPGKVIYCGPSNKSVDVLGQYLLRSNLKVLRVYGISYEEQDYPNPLKPSLPKKNTEKRPERSIAEISLHRKIRQPGSIHATEIVALDRKFVNNQEEDLFQLYKQQKRLIRKAKHWEVENHDVIICTCATAAMLHLHLDSEPGDEIEFTQCIIDECGMCSEPETLAPIVASKAKQVVLIGDHMQLQPIIMCKQAKTFGLGESMFERLKRNAGMLTTQYRMHPGICGFPSEKFYASRLETDGSVIYREAARTFKFCYPSNKPDNTAVFCHIAGLEKINFSLERGGENSQYNEDEAKAVINILVYLHVTERVPLSRIMILSPYTAQVNTIRDLIVKERSHMKEVHVGTVITSQGSESDYVILSTVRSQPQTAIEDEANLHWRRKYIGFVTDPHQVNVAITRAKSGLCIVGNKNLLIKDTETWKPLLDYYDDRGSVVTYYNPNAPWNLHHN